MVVKQKNSYSIQEAIEKSATKLLQQEISLVVAGRTDAGSRRRTSSRIWILINVLS